MFQDILVVELASVLAGPAVGRFFAELGARVIKVENKKTNGDVTRQWKLPSERKEDISAYYSSINWGKESLFLDLSLDLDRQQVYELVKKATIVIANFKIGDAAKFLVDYPTLKAINPNLIYGQISAFGQAVHRVGFDVVLQAETGFMSMNGSSGNIVKMPVALIDLLTAHQLKEGILIALLQQFKTGKGALVSVSLVESAVASLANQATNWLMANHIPQPMGSLHPNIAPYGELFTTKDNKLLVLAVGNNKQFQNLCTVIQQTHLATEIRFSTNVNRVKNRKALQILLQAFFAKVDRQPIITQLIEEQVPVGAVRNMQEVFDLPIAQQMVVEEKIEQQVLKSVKTIAFQIQGT